MIAGVARLRRLGLIAAIVIAAVILPFVMTFGTAEGVEADPDPASDTARPGSNVTLCHIPPGNPAAAHVITVGSTAVPAHLAHGDQLSNADCYAHTHQHAYATTDANPDCFAHAHRHAYGDPDCYADTHRHSYGNPECYADTHRHAYGNPECYTDAHRHAYGTPDCYADAHRHAYGNPDCYADTNRYADANPERHARTHRDAYTSTNANPDCYAHTPGHVHPGRWPYVR